jgi:hypothetical protein
MAVTAVTAVLLRLQVSTVKWLASTVQAKGVLIVSLVDEQVPFYDSHGSGAVQHFPNHQLTCSHPFLEKSCCNRDSLLCMLWLCSGARRTSERLCRQQET